MGYQDIRSVAAPCPEQRVSSGSRSIPHDTANVTATKLADSGESKESLRFALRQSRRNIAREK
jgi:hypothetical protein